MRLRLLQSLLRLGIDNCAASVQDTGMKTTTAAKTNADTTARIIAALEQIANDPNESPAKRRDAAKKAATWKAAAK